MGSIENFSPRESLARLPIAYKLALMFTLAIATGMVSLGLFIAHDQTRLLDRLSVEFGATVANQMAESAKDPLIAKDELALEVAVTNLVSNETILGAALFSEELELLSQAGTVPPQHLLSDVTKSGEMFNWQLENPHEQPLLLASFLAQSQLDGVTVGYTLVTFDHSVLVEARDNTLRVVAGATAGLILLGILISIMLGRRISQPINQLVDAGHSINQGNFQAEIDYKWDDEVGTLVKSMGNMRDGLKQKVVLEASLARQVSPKVAKALVENPEGERLGGIYVDGSVVFADIVGFTSLSEGMAPHDVSALLNDYFSYIAKAAHICHGHVDKYIGDCAMLVFGVPEDDDLHSFHSVLCAVLINKLVHVINQERRRKGMATVEFRIGINSGSMLAGNMGSPERMNYTVLGDTVNLASRLSSVAGANQIVITKTMYESLKKAGFPIEVQPKGEMEIRGKKEPVATYVVLDVHPSYQSRIVEMTNTAINTAAA